MSNESDPWTDLDAYASLPRVAGHWLSRDGRRLVVGMATRDTGRDRYVTALWEVDPAGARQARRLTRSAQGESGAAFLPSGDLLFLSTRPNPDGDDEDDGHLALWRQPVDGGDAVVVADPPGGVRGVVVSENGTVLVGVELLPSAADVDADRELRSRRRDAKVTAILHEEYPVRYWDHDLGPGRTRLMTGTLTGDRLDLTDLTGHVGSALDDRSVWDITPDGRTVVTTWTVAEPAGSRRSTVVAIDVATGDRTVLADDPDHDYESPRVSPDGRRVALVVERLPTHEETNDCRLGVVPIGGGPIVAVARDWDHWTHEHRWTPDGRTLVVTADHDGRCPVFRIDVATGDVTRLTQDHGAYTEIAVTADGRWAHALRTSIDAAPSVVRVAVDGSSTETLLGPTEPLALPGQLTEVRTTGEDGVEVRAWLALPYDASADSPAPLLLKIHGGPTMSSNNWAWRSNPWVFVARGYAVLMPDPALSTGYGVGFIQRGWGHWGNVPYTDLMRITDATEARDDIDGSRTCALGASFGGYMANWIAGHTNRFAAIATHASVWSRNGSIDTNDVSYAFRRHLSVETADAMSPHRFADSITTPMLVIHGGRDYRVPISEAMKLWWDLSSRSKGLGTSPHKFLYFPDETHFVSSPNHGKLWHATIAAFFDHHVLGQPWERPEHLG